MPLNCLCNLVESNFKLELPIEPGVIFREPRKTFAMPHIYEVWMTMTSYHDFLKGQQLTLGKRNVRVGRIRTNGSWLVNSSPAPNPAELAPLKLF